jgi:hypothetical protein
MQVAFTQLDAGLLRDRLPLTPLLDQHGAEFAARARAG